MNLYKSGTLIYRCRRCGELDKTIHIPCGLDLDKIINSVPLDKKKYPYTPALTSTHICKDENLGVTDLIGLEYDTINS